jgi:nitrate/nitrite-specific signal transduction histidine kinase
LGEETRQTILNAVGIIFILLSVAGLASYGIGNSITAPLEKLTEVAKEVAAGNLDATAEVTTGDEIGSWVTLFNNMSTTAKNLVANLEELVVERTHVIERRLLKSRQSRRLVRLSLPSVIRRTSKSNDPSHQ